MKKSSMYSEIMDQYDVARNITSNRWDEAKRINELLQDAQNIIFLGTGASLNACYCIKSAVIKHMNKIPHIIEMADAKYILPTLDNKTVCFLVSQSGNSKETKDGIAILKNSHAKTIAVTNNDTSYLAKNCDIKIILGTGKEVSSATKTCTASILLMLMAICAHDKKAVEEIKLLPELIAKALKTLPEISDETAKQLKDEKASYIGALGSLYPVARQGALLIKEKDFILIEGLSISELRHGTVEAVYENMPIFIVACNELLDEGISHANYFANHVKANVYLIADKEIDDTAEQYKTIYIENSTNDAFCIICPIIFFQLLSEGIAFENGYDIDGFRYLNKVIENY